MYLNVVSGIPSEPTEQVMEVSQKTRLKYPSRVGPMARAIATVVNSVQTSVMITSRPMKMKLRPTTLALFGTDGTGVAVNLGSRILSMKSFRRRTTAAQTDSGTVNEP